MKNKNFNYSRDDMDNLNDSITERFILAMEEADDFDDDDLDDYDPETDEDIDEYDEYDEEIDSDDDPAELEDDEYDDVVENAGMNLMDDAIEPLSFAIESGDKNDYNVEDEDEVDLDDDDDEDDDEIDEKRPVSVKQFTSILEPDPDYEFDTRTSDDIFGAFDDDEDDDDNDDILN